MRCPPRLRRGDRPPRANQSGSLHHPGGQSIDHARHVAGGDPYRPVRPADRRLLRLRRHADRRLLGSGALLTPAAQLRDRTRRGCAHGARRPARAPHRGPVRPAGGARYPRVGRPFRRRHGRAGRAAVRPEHCGDAVPRRVAVDQGAPTARPHGGDRHLRHPIPGRSAGEAARGREPALHRAGNRGRHSHRPAGRPDTVGSRQDRRGASVRRRARHRPGRQPRLRQRRRGRALLAGRRAPPSGQPAEAAGRGGLRPWLAGAEVQEAGASAGPDAGSSAPRPCTAACWRQAERA